MRHRLREENDGDQKGETPRPYRAVMRPAFLSSALVHRQIARRLKHTAFRLPICCALSNVELDETSLLMGCLVPLLPRLLTQFS